MSTPPASACGPGAGQRSLLDSAPDSAGLAPDPGHTQELTDFGEAVLGLCTSPRVSRDRGAWCGERGWW